MPAPRHDVIVAGLGAMGSAAACHLARRGLRVLGLDRFAPPHANGSSSGRTRIIREAYFEHPAYVPLVRRAYELWTALERDSGTRLLRVTGGLMIGPPEGVLVSGALLSARTHGLAHELLETVDLRRRHPALRPAEGTVAVWEPRAGALLPEACVAAHLAMAARAGATLAPGEPVLEWTDSGGGIEVRTARGRHQAGKLLIAAGAWAPGLLPGLDLPLAVERQVQTWFDPLDPAAFEPGRFPVFIWEDEPGRFIYGFPDFGDGVKVARHHEGEGTDPDRVRREVTGADVQPIRAVLERLIPAANGPLRDAAVCLYTNTPDAHFVLDLHPRHPGVLIASPCSGHGFKFAAALGEVAADLLEGARPRFDLGMFRVARLLPSAPR
ncbi:MAG TPA: N-methyl-L-tryptophan oxidase [Candidatus Eisenbacteria bacterium]